MGNCEFCGAHAPVVAVTYRQNTGMLVMRQSRTWEGTSCRACSTRMFWKTTLHNLFLGWWGTISLLVTPLFIIGNIASGIKTFSMPSAAKVKRSALAGQREYARNLLATKDRAIVIDVLAAQTGASAQEIEAFLDDIEQRPRAAA